MNQKETVNFSSLSLHSKLLRAVEDVGYEEPTAIQLKVIPKIMGDYDIRATAQTGSGKTAAFLLPIMHKLITNSPSARVKKAPRALILVPTRELATQIADEAALYSKHLKNFRIVTTFGGVPFPPQIRKLQGSVDIMIATPGRLLDHMQRGNINLSHVEMVVLDEADRMLDMGFIDPVEEIVKKTPASRQTLLFSATLEDEILELSEKLLRNPLHIATHTTKTKHENITQKLHYADDLYHKNQMLFHLLKDDALESAIVFTSTKVHADKLAEELREQGHRVAALHGDLNQRVRSRTIAKFKEGKVSIIVATDVAARGIDVPALSHVINFDLPRNSEDYIHRIGRTGRAGAKGTALSFASYRDKPLLKKIESLTGQKIDISVIEGLEPKTREKREEARGEKKRGNRFAGRFNKKSPPFAKFGFKKHPHKKKVASGSE